MQHNDYIRNIELGQIVAVRTKSSKVVSAKVVEINLETFIVKTKIGTIFEIKDSDILWVKTGKLWPKKLFKKFKGVDNDGQTDGGDRGKTD